jgi:hypothetical protein
LVFVFPFYGRFLSTSSVNAMLMMIAMKRPAIAGMKYRSAADGCAVGCGVAVAGASSTANAVFADDP